MILERWLVSVMRSPAICMERACPYFGPFLRSRATLSMSEACMRVVYSPGGSWSAVWTGISQTAMIQPSAATSLMRSSAAVSWMFSMARRPSSGLAANLQSSASMRPQFLAAASVAMVMFWVSWLLLWDVVRVRATKLNVARFGRGRAPRAGCWWDGSPEGAGLVWWAARSAGVAMRRLCVWSPRPSCLYIRRLSGCAG